MSLITYEYLITILTYNKDTGNFKWVKQRYYRPNQRETAGYLDKDGYNIIKIDGRKYQAHRLAWLYTYKQWPEKFLDHIDGNRANNKIENLRQATIRKNGQNRVEHRKGNLVGAQRKNNKWYSCIQINYKRINLGYFDTEQKAHQAYLNAIKKYNLS